MARPSSYPEEAPRFQVELVEPFAAAWASIDGRLEEFWDDKGRNYDDDSYTGHYEGYMEEAKELLRRAKVMEIEVIGNVGKRLKL